MVQHYKSKCLSLSQSEKFSTIQVEFDEYFNLNQLQHLIKQNHTILQKKVKVLKQFVDSKKKSDNDMQMIKQSSEQKSSFENYKIQVINDENSVKQDQADKEKGLRNRQAQEQK